MNSFKCIFQEFWPHFQKGYNSEESFCQTSISVVHLLVDVSILCNAWELETSNRKVFSNIFICQHPTITLSLTQFISDNNNRITQFDWNRTIPFTVTN